MVRDGAHRKRADNRVERTVWEIERLSIANAEIGRDPEFSRSIPRDVGHARADIDTSEPRVLRIIGQIAPRSNRDLEYVAARLATGPATAVPDEKTIEHPHAQVVRRVKRVIVIGYARWLKQKMSQVIDER